MSQPIAIARPGSFADIIGPRLAGSALVSDALLISLGVLLVALTAQIAIPMPSGVPITGQTFGVLLVAAALGFRRGIIAMLAYIALGAVGLPFFASVGTSVTYGYLAGFVVAGAVVGLLAERGWDRGFVRTLAMMSIGTAIIFVCGVAWGARFVDSFGALMAGFVLPYLPGAAIKIALAMALLPTAWKLVGTRD
ncbi:MAG: biotin transporter BioY [Phycisphaerales bacterium]